MKYKYPLAVNTWNNQEINAIKKLLKSQKLTYGKNVKRFEQVFSKFTGFKYSVMVNSGSSANLLMFQSILYKKEYKNFLKKNDEVIVPAVSWSTSYYPINQSGLKIKFVDIDKDTFNYDLDKLSKSITNKTKIILLVSVLGNPNNISKIKEIIKKKKRKILLLSDNCEALGARYKMKHVGKESLMSTFSSYFSHHISTIEGGIVCTDDKEIYHILLSLRSHGWTRDLPKKNYVTKYKSKDEFKETFNFVLPGYNLRPTEINAVAGIIQLKKINKFLTIRRLNSKYYKNFLNNNKYFNIQKEIENSSWFGFSIILKSKYYKKFFELRKNFKKIGIETRPIISGNFANQLVTKKYLKYNIPNRLQNADIIDKYGLMFGNNIIDLKDMIKKISLIKL